MVFTLGLDQSFSLTANVTTPGYQSIVLSGYLVDKRPDGTYVIPITPDMFYGVTGAQLGATWRQHLPTTGSQVLLSRGAGNLPTVSRGRIGWRKISDFEEEKLMEAEYVPWIEQLADWWNSLSIYEQAFIVLGAIGGAAAVGYVIISQSA